MGSFACECVDGFSGSGLACAGKKFCITMFQRTAIVEARNKLQCKISGWKRVKTKTAFLPIAWAFFKQTLSHYLCQERWISVAWCKFFALFSPYFLYCCNVTVLALVVFLFFFGHYLHEQRSMANYIWFSDQRTVTLEMVKNITQSGKILSRITSASL